MDKRQIEDLKQTIDLVALAEKLGAKLKQRGREWRGTCPLHGGSNPTAFVIRTGDHGQWWQCYTGCGQGDAIKFVMMAYHLNFKEALDRLGLMDFPKRDPVASPRREDGPPPSAWQVRAWELICDAEQALWSPAGKRARTWLNNRGLRDETIRRWQLGLVERDSRESSDRWGLADRKPIWLPRGILIPAVWEIQPWYLNIRRPSGAPKFYKVPGSHNVLFGKLTGHDVCILTEGEFDAMLLWQEVHDLVDVATAGAARHLPTRQCMSALLSKRAIISVVDNDDAGVRSANKWQEFSNRVKVVRPLEGKDVTDFWRAGGNLRAWVQFITSSLGLRSMSPAQPGGPNEDGLSQAVTSLTEPAPAHPAQARVTLNDLIDGRLQKAGLRVVGGDHEVWPPVIYTEPIGGNTHE